MEKKDKVTMICFLISSFAFYICAILNFMDKESSMGAVYLCLGSAFLCLSTTYMNNKNK